MSTLLRPPPSAATAPVSTAAGAPVGARPSTAAVLTGAGELSWIPRQPRDRVPASAPAGRSGADHSSDRVVVGRAHPPAGPRGG